MSRPVLSDPYGIVSEDEDDRNFHQRAEPDSRPGVIAEDQEPGAKGTHLRQGQSVENGAHGMFTDTKVKVSPAAILRGEISRPVERQAGFC